MNRTTIRARPTASSGSARWASSSAPRLPSGIVRPATERLPSLRIQARVHDEMDESVAARRAHAGGAPGRARESRRDRARSMAGLPRHGQHVPRGPAGAQSAGRGHAARSTAGDAYRSESVAVAMTTTPVRSNDSPGASGGIIQDTSGSPCSFSTLIWLDSTRRPAPTRIAVSFSFGQPSSLKILSALRIKPIVTLLRKHPAQREEQQQTRGGAGPKFPCMQPDRARREVLAHAAIIVLEPMIGIAEFQELAAHGVHFRQRGRPDMFQGPLGRVEAHPKIRPRFGDQVRELDQVTGRVFVRIIDAEALEQIARFLFRGHRGRASFNIASTVARIFTNAASKCD